MSRSVHRAAWLFLGCLASALIVAVLYALLAGAHTTQAIRETQVNNRVLLNTIRDCTQPTGECYRAGQKRTGDAVATINRVVILAAACAAVTTGTEPQVEARIHACVIDRMRRDAR
jgi:hypothetical protein